MINNKLFLKHLDDTDYNTNAPSYYDDLARKQKLVQLLAEKIWDYDERLDNRIADLEEVLSSYLNQWDDRIENLDNEVSHIFVTWLNDGTLEQIINHDVLGNKADKSNLEQTAFLLFPTGSDDSENVTFALENYKRVIFTDGHYTFNIDVEITNTQIEAGNVTVEPINQNVHPFIIRGDHNTISGFDVTADHRKLVWVNGNYNEIKNNILHGRIPIEQGSNVNYNGILDVIGSHNIIKNNEVFNGGVGIQVSKGIGNIIDNNHVHDNTLGVRNLPSAINSKIIGNYILDNNRSTNSGADGILLHRNTTGAIVRENTIRNSGEHGIYAQGDNSIITNNIISHNTRSGIKMGAHATDLFEHTGDYWMKDNLIENNICHSNGGDGIYLQTPHENISIKNNHTYNNLSEGIKTVYIASELFYNVGLSVKDNKSESIWIDGHVGTVAIGNEVENRLYLTGKGVTDEERLIEPVIKNNIVGTLSVQRVISPTISNNIIKHGISVNSSTTYQLVNNKITFTTNDFNLTYLSSLENNEIVFKNGYKFTGIFAIENMSSNLIESLGLDIGQFLFNTTGGTTLNTRIVGNHFKINNISQFFNVQSLNSIVSSNIFEGGQTDHNIRFTNAFVIFTENIGIGNAKINIYGSSSGIIKNNKIKTDLFGTSTRIVEDNIIE